MDQINVKAWEGRSRTEQGGVTPLMAAQIHATLGSPRNRAPKSGDALPPLWHWCAFPPTAPMAELGRDGHPATGGFLPKLRLDRRMWAGGSLNFYAPLRVGEVMERRSSIRSQTAWPTRCEERANESTPASWSSSHFCLQ